MLLTFSRDIRQAIEESNLFLRPATSGKMFFTYEHLPFSSEWKMVIASRNAISTETAVGLKSTVETERQGGGGSWKKKWRKKWRRGPVLGRKSCS